MAIDKIFDNASVDGIADNLFKSVSNSVSEVKAMQQRKAAENVQLVIQALKKIESDIQDKYDGVTTVIAKRVSSIKDGQDGRNGVDGRAGKDGRPGRDGATGPRGNDGLNGVNGVDGENGVSVVDAHIDFDGSLIIGLSSGRTINVGEVVAPDLAERIKVITNGGGTSQQVLDTLVSLQNQINVIAAGNFTSLTDSGNLTFTGTGNRISGDFSNPTIENRVLVQTSTVNGTTSFGVVSNGTSSGANIRAYGANNPTNASFIDIAANSFETYVRSAIAGTGTYLPLVLQTGGSERMRLDTSGRVIIGTTTAITNSLQTLQFDSGTLNTAITATSYGVNPSISLRAAGGTAASPSATVNNPINFIGGTTSDGTTFFNTIQITGIIESTPSAGSHPTAIAFSTTPSGSTSRSERMRIDSSGNVGIGTSSFSEKLRVTSTGTNEIRSHSSSSGDARVGFWAEGVAYNYIQTVRSSGALSSFADLQTFNNSSGTERIRIDSSGNVGIGATANDSALLDVQSTTKGVRMPNMTTTQKNAISSPAAGLMVFDTTLAKLCVYSGSAWQTITSI